MNSLIKSIVDVSNETSTENGAKAFKSTKSNVLDFFAIGSALRERSADFHVSIFSSAWMEDRLLALKAMFYARDIRGGQGQRQAFRNQLKYLAEIDSETVKANIHLVPEYGRWDDLYTLIGTKCQEAALDLMRDQFMSDMRNPERPSLLAKWLKSENASSEETKRLAKITIKHFKISPKLYRKTLSILRERLNVIECKISAGEWLDIDYKSVPSNAMMLYRKAFAKHDPVGFSDFISKVNKGETTINSATLYPYEIVEKTGVFAFGGSHIDPEVAQAMWDNLPDYLDGDDSSAIAVVDTSGSMYGTPINVAVSLGMYFAERNKGPFKDHFITFNYVPELIRIQGENFYAKVKHIARAPWGGSTDLESVFNLILNNAVEGKVPQSEMPKKIFIISDMQFNCVSGGKNQTLFERMKELYHQAGYEMPTVVFWNVNGRNSSQPVTMDENGTQLVSGFSPSLFKYIMTGVNETPYEMMLKILNSERYEALTVV